MFIQANKCEYGKQANRNLYTYTQLLNLWTYVRSRTVNKIYKN